jgi:hypothetical protein
VNPVGKTGSGKSSPGEQVVARLEHRELDGGVRVVQLAEVELRRRAEVLAVRAGERLLVRLVERALRANTFSVLNSAFL